MNLTAAKNLNTGAPSPDLFAPFFQQQHSQARLRRASARATPEPQIYLLRFFDEKLLKQVKDDASPFADVSLTADAALEVAPPQIDPALDPATEKVSILSRFKRGMAKTRSSFTQGLTSLFSSTQTFDQAFLDTLEAQLIMADVGINTTAAVISDLKAYIQKENIAQAPNAAELVQHQLKSLLVDILQAVPVTEQKTESPQMILIVGVNGVGKTTTIGKLAHQAKASGKSVMLAAGDTFRAAAVEQLQIWGERTGVQVISQGQGADSASVIFDAMQSAQAKKIDVLIADTAGRLHNKANLMNELQKIVRVVKKLHPAAPHKVLLVVDGCTGQNALSQGKEFNSAVPLTGLVVTKLDGTAKGGILFALSQSLQVPVEYIGIGEGVEDLKTFDPEAYVSALLDFDHS